jgi:hypothetical protein
VVEGKLVMRVLSGPSMAQLRHRTRAPTSAAGGGVQQRGAFPSRGGWCRHLGEAHEATASDALVWRCGTEEWRDSAGVEHEEQSDDTLCARQLEEKENSTSALQRIRVGGNRRTWGGK